MTVLFIIVMNEMYDVQMRSSMYSQEPRMSLMDSCKQYQKFLRQERGLEEESGIYITGLNVSSGTYTTDLIFS